MNVACGIKHAGWSMYQGYLTVFFAFMKTCLLVVIINCVWNVVIILCFRGASGGSTLLMLHFLALMELWSSQFLVALCALTLGM
jgi:hypothetical protein